jgi:hypothetical protein
VIVYFKARIVSGHSLTVAHRSDYYRSKSASSGLRGLEVTFPPLDPSDAGSNPAEVVEFLRAEKFRERSPPRGTLSRLTRVVDLLHVKEPHVPKGSHWVKLVRILPVQRS